MPYARIQSYLLSVRFDYLLLVGAFLFLRPLSFPVNLWTSLLLSVDCGSPEQSGNCCKTDLEDLQWT
jgi:hypothetical protein